jgi:hypothetical protein
MSEPRLAERMYTESEDRIYSKAWEYALRRSARTEVIFV